MDGGDKERVEKMRGGGLKGKRHLEVWELGAAAGDEHIRIQSLSNIGQAHFNCLDNAFCHASLRKPHEDAD